MENLVCLIYIENHKSFVRKSSQNPRSLSSFKSSVICEQRPIKFRFATFKTIEFQSDKGVRVQNFIFFKFMYFKI